MTNYFEESNIKAQNKLNAEINKQRFEYNQRVKEDIAYTKILRNRSKARAEYLKQRGTGKKPELISYSDSQISKFMQIGFDQRKNEIV